jgi:hypothetical protein
MRAWCLSLASVLLAGLAAGGAAAQQGQLALGAHGKLYGVEAGTAGQLVPGQGVPDYPVLALAITVPGQPTRRLLVPGTESNEVENAPSILYEETADAVYLIWESRINFIHSQIRLISYVGGEWSEPMVLPGEFFSLKSSPNLAVTRDSFVAFDSAGTPEVHQRTIYHAIFWEEAAAGERVVYTPVVLLDGVHIGWNPLFVLNDLGLGASGPGPLAARSDLSRSPTIQAGRSATSAVVGFVDLATGQLVQFELTAVAGEMGALADAVRADLVASGGALFPDDPAALADRARVQLVDFGLRLHMHPGLIEYLAGAIWAEIAGADPESDTLASLTDRARVQLVDFGVRMAAQGLAPSRDEDGSWLLEFPTADPLAGSDERPPHSIRVRLAAARPAPQTGTGRTFLYLSRSGEEALVAWELPSRLRYRESLGAGWSQVRELVLGENLTLASAHAILEQRVRNR